MDRRKLPIGIQTFRQIREEGYYYVDKTAWARRLADDAGKHYFLSRPRRFGKSLFVDTLKELYEGNEALFRGLSVHDGWNWSKRHPVVRLDFSSGDFFDPENCTDRQFAIGERVGNPAMTEHLAFGVCCGSSPGGVLVDEYDKPLDAIDDPAKLNRRRLRRCTARSSSPTARRARQHLFSDLIIDLTLDPAYAAICGYTEADLDADSRRSCRAWTGTRSRLVQRLPLAGRRTASAHAVPQPRVQGALVRDGILIDT